MKFHSLSSLVLHLCLHKFPPSFLFYQYQLNYKSQQSSPSWYDKTKYMKDVVFPLNHAYHQGSSSCNLQSNYSSPFCHHQLGDKCMQLWSSQPRINITRPLHLSNVSKSPTIKFSASLNELETVEIKTSSSNKN